jgi:hypothetical protein
MRSLILLVSAVLAAPAFAAPPIPSGLTAVAAANKSIRLTWTASTGATGYLVFREPNTTTPIGTIGAVTTFTDSDASLVAGTSYTYRVAAVNIADEIPQSGLSSPASATPLATPSAPTNLVASNASNGNVVLSWSAVSGATSYTVSRDGVEIDDTTSTTYTDTETEVSTVYRYTVSATTVGGTSSESNVATITTRGDGSQREAVWTREFERADGNFDGVITFQEYLVAFPNTLPWVVMNYRFNSTDDDVSGDLTVDEYIAHFAGKTVKRPSKAQTFFIADLDGDDLLDVDEYSLTLNRGTKTVQLNKKFNKLDKDDSTLVSQREFGIRYGTEE